MCTQAKQAIRDETPAPPPKKAKELRVSEPLAPSANSASERTKTHQTQQEDAGRKKNKSNKGMNWEMLGYNFEIVKSFESSPHKPLEKSQNPH